MKRSEINAFIRKHWRSLSDEALATKCGITLNAIRKRRGVMRLDRDAIIEPSVEKQKEEAQKQKDRRDERKATKQLLEANERLQRQLDAAISLRNRTAVRPIRKSASLGGEATMIALASDWHVEEPVRAGEVNGLNEYNLAIAERRATQFFSTLLRLVQIEQQNTRVEHLVLALLGDFITNDIHEELAETALLEPTKAIRFVQELIVSGIDHILANSKLNLTIPCHSGNHGRTTKDQRHATENGHSLEWLLYHSLADHYDGNGRVALIIPESYHSYIPVYDKIVRFHHGHDIRYGGGVGGITIPVRKAISQWNTVKWADFDSFGHFHQAFDGGNFVANGSMIGYNAYALSIKAAYEEPVQMLFGIHSKLGKFITRPIKFVQ